MANQDPIDQFFDLSKLNDNAAKAVQTLDAVFDHIKKNFDKVNSMKMQIGGATNVSTFNQLKTEIQNATRQMQQDAKEYVDTWKRLLKERDEAEKASLKAMEAERKAAMSKVASDSNIALSRTLKDLQQGYDRLTKAERENVHIGGVLLARIQQLDKAVKSTNESTGRFQLSVGNYAKGGEAAAKATSNIQRQMAMFAGELPNIQYGLRTFASSLSNQFQGLFQAITQAKEANKLLREDGQKTVPVARQIVSGIINWQTGLLALVAAGGLLINWLTSSTKAGKEMSEATKENAESQKKLADTIGAEVSALNVLVLRAKDTSASYKQRRDAIDELQKKFPEYFASLSRESILNGNVAVAVDLATDAIVRKARETQRVEQYTKAITELAAMENELQDITTPKKGTFVYDDQNRAESLRSQIMFQKEKVKELEKTLIVQNKLNADEAYWLDTNAQKQYKKNQERQKSIALLTEEQRKGMDRAAKEKTKKDKFTDEKQAIAAQKAIAENEKATYAQREEAVRQFSILSHNLLKKQNKDNIDNIILYATEADKLTQKINDDKEKARQEDLKRIEEASAKELQIIMANLDNIEKYNKKEGASDKEILDLKLQYLEEALKKAGLTEEDIFKIKQKYTALSIGLLDIEEQERNKKERVRIDSERKLIQQRKELERELANFLITVSDAVFERRIRNLEKEQEAIQEDANKRIEAINNSSRTQIEKEEMIKVVNAETAAAQVENERKIAQEKRKQAILAKGLAIANIAAKLAETIMTIQAAAAAYNLIVPGSGVAYAAIATPLAIATGAAQTAAVLATPIPEYAVGKDPSESYTGAMIWGEKGTEMKIDKDGKLSIATKPTLGYTEAGDRIISNKELMDGSFLKYIPDAKEISFDNLINATASIYEQNTKKVVKAIKSLQQPRGLTMNEINANLAAKR